jgi:hypothetical protein
MGSDPPSPSLLSSCPPSPSLLSSCPSSPSLLSAHERAELLATARQSADACQSADSEADDGSEATEAVVENEVGIQQRPSGKWCGLVNDTVHAALNPGSKYKSRCTPRFATRAEAVKARGELKAKVEQEYEAIILERLQADPLVRELPRGPKDLSTAVAKRAHWVCNCNTGHYPKRMVMAKRGKQDFQWQLACVHCPVNDASLAITDKRVVAEQPSCAAHGGVCKHERRPAQCYQCQETSGKKSAALCSYCEKNVLNRKRQTTAGGNGLCPNCETHLKAQAAEAGTELPPNSKKWEDVVLDQLETMVTDPQGNVIAYEMRDDMSHMLGSDKRRRRGQCSTDHQRRPDILWLVREPEESRIVAAVMVEVDENSHTDRTSECEAGKVHDTFHCILKLAQEEGKGRLAETRRGEVLTPQVVFLRFNPNACDAPGSAITLATRIQVLAARVREILNTPAEVYQERSRRCECMKPYLEILYYHSTQGGKHLAYYEEHREAFYLTPNRCPRLPPPNCSS